MTLETILEYALPIALVLLAIAAIWLVIEAALTMRSTRSAVNTMQEQTDQAATQIQVENS